MVIFFFGTFQVYIPASSFDPKNEPDDKIPDHPFPMLSIENDHYDCHSSRHRLFVVAGSMIIDYLNHTI